MRRIRNTEKSLSRIFEMADNDKASAYKAMIQETTNVEEWLDARKDYRAAVKAAEKSGNDVTTLDGLSQGSVSIMKKLDERIARELEVTFDVYLTMSDAKLRALAAEGVESCLQETFRSPDEEKMAGVHNVLYLLGTCEGSPTASRPDIAPLSFEFDNILLPAVSYDHIEALTKAGVIETLADGGLNGLTRKGRAFLMHLEQTRGICGAEQDLENAMKPEYVPANPRPKPRNFV